MKEQRARLWKLIYHNKPARNFRQFVRVYPKFFFTVIFVLIPFTGLILSTSLKIHVVSPDHMEEEIKCSVLDFIQASQLRKNAFKQEKAGEIKSAVVSWVTCIQNNPCNLRNIRDFLSSVLRLDKENEFGPDAVNFTTWLLKVGNENPNDVPLVCDILIKYGSNSQAVNILTKHKETIPTRYKHIYLRLLYTFRELDLFDSFYSQNLTKEERREPSSLLLKTLLSYEKTSKSSVNSEKLIQTIHEFVGEYEEKELLNLLFTAARSKGDLELMSQILTVYDNAAIPSYMEHHAYWTSLLDHGEVKKVISQLESYEAEIKSAKEFISHYQLLTRLGKSEDSEKFMSNGLTRFGYSMDVWMPLLVDLEKRKQWSLMRKYSDKMIADNRVLQFHAIPKFYAGLACVNQGMFKIGKDHIKSINGRELLNTPQAVKIVKEITDMGFTVESQVLMESLIKEGQFEDSKIFWSTYLHATHLNRDLENAILASKKVYELHPDSLQAKFNYAGLLLLSGEKPTEALFRAKEFFDKDPNWTPGIINYAQALIQNKQFEEANQILTLKISPKELPKSLKSEYYLARFEISHHFQDKTNAKDFYNEIDKTMLFPAQRLRIESLYMSLE